MKWILMSLQIHKKIFAKSGKNGYNSLRNERGKFHTGITNSQIKVKGDMDMSKKTNRIDDLRWIWTE